MNEENPNWRISVGINGTAGDVPKDNTIRLFKRKKKRSGIFPNDHIPALKKK